MDWNQDIHSYVSSKIKKEPQIVTIKLWDSVSQSMKKLLRKEGKEQSY